MACNDAHPHGCNVTRLSPSPAPVYDIWCTTHGHLPILAPIPHLCIKKSDTHSSNLQLVYEGYETYQG
ncbi:hypothetical protein L2E82_02504 [Cichorium intybus]|uniref:Uncharacterized protein n=1 Tax=Cichorium intybus TaxID=13427 RepID=A0ACB9H352_CICIN|nr:hypothetical protein L2E82_02504 [Cichorium intybus]